MAVATMATKLAARHVVGLGAALDAHLDALRRESDPASLELVRLLENSLESLAAMLGRWADGGRR